MSNSDERLIQMEGDLGRIHEAVGRVEQRSDKTDMMPKQPTVNIAGWVGTIATVFAVIGAFAMTVISPLQDDITHLYEMTNAQLEERQERLYEMGHRWAQLDELRDRFEQIQVMEETLHTMTAALAELRKDFSVLEGKAPVVVNQLNFRLEELEKQAQTSRDIMARSLHDQEDRLRNLATDIAAAKTQLESLQTQLNNKT